MKQKLNALISGVLSRDAKSIARAISEVENRTEDSVEILKSVFQHTGRALVVGVTGAPGVGKSTLVDRLADVCRSEGRSVGIIAVDPTSPFSGGAILGDRIRMQTRSLDPDTYIRSMATRGNLGGLAAATKDAISILDAAGYDVIFVETVGVGQDEVDVARTADVTLVVMVPGMGDEIQTMKAGMMEIADIFVINKADREGVDRLEREIQAMLGASERPDLWRPRIVKTVATEQVGIGELYKAVNECQELLRGSEMRRKRREKIIEQRLIELLSERLLYSVMGRVLQNGELQKFVSQIANKERDPYSIVEEIIGRTSLLDRA